MVGQGSPNASPEQGRSLFGRGMRIIGRLATVMIVVCAAAPAWAQEVDLKLRASWSISAPRQFHATLSISEGQLLDLETIGMGADTPGSIYLEKEAEGVARRVFVIEPGPQAFDGFDVTVRAPGDAVVRLEFTSADGDRTVFAPIETTVSQLLEASVSDSLGDNEGHCSLRRAPGDRLRVEFDRDHLVFAPGDSFPLRIAPHYTGLEPGTNVRMALSLSPVGDEDDQPWSAEHVLRVDANGVIASVEESIDIPRHENVYNLRILLLEPPSILIPFARSRHLLERQLQLVVVDDIAPTNTATTRDRGILVDEFDPTQPGFWERLPHWRIIPGQHSGPLGNDRATTLQNENGSYIQLEGGGWQAYPLPIDERGKPHLVEIEYPLGKPQTLGISIVQPNAAGQVTSGGLDSGVAYEPVWTETGTVGRHRLIFWPSTDSPLLLLTNRGEGERKATFGRIRIFSLGEHLSRSSVAGEPAGREMLALYDQPLFTENFSAEEAIDPLNQLRLDDWQTFHQGTTRLVEYLGYVGYSGSIVTVMSEGSTLYPSRLLSPTPTHDTGAFFATAQDPRRKDVLEMLFRQCDARHLKLVPLLQFSTPLPELEQQLREDDSTGINLVDLSGSTWAERHGTSAGEAPYYNPLDDRVQQAMLNVVDELIDRYADHRAMSGVAIQLSAQGYTQLPGVLWGCDEKTLALFAQQTGTVLPRGDADAIAQALLGRDRQAWLAWRAERLAGFFGRISDRLAAAIPSARLYLTPTEWADRPYMPDERHLHRLIQPTLPQHRRVGNLFLELGIDPALYETNENIVFFRPQHVEPGRSTSSGAVDLRLADDEQLNASFARLPAPATMFMHRSSIHRLPEFDENSPFGTENTFLSMAMIASPHGQANCRRFAHALGKRDVRSLADGGAMLSMGQEAALTPWIDIYRRLPDTTFDTIDAGVNGKPVVVRTTDHNNRRYVYLVNDSPWPVGVNVNIVAPAGCRMMGLSPDQSVAPLGRDGIWRIELKPYELVAGYLTSPEAAVRSYEVTLPNGLEAQVRRQIDDARGRLIQLTEPPRLELLGNPDFEMPVRSGVIPHWEFSQADGVAVDVDPLQHQAGSQSLTIESTGAVAWVRSEPIDLPSTGRIAIKVWLRIDDPEFQPPLQIAIDGFLDGRSYYRSAPVGAGEGITPLTRQWAPYIFQLHDLPTEGLTSLRVGIDLMGAGKVWVDQIQVDHLVFTEAERTELAISIALADFHLTNGRLADASRVIEGYWPQFLAQHVPPPIVNLADHPPAEEGLPPVVDALPPDDREATLPWWNRLQWPF